MDPQALHYCCIAVFVCQRYCSAAVHLPGQKLCSSNVVLQYMRTVHQADDADQCGTAVRRLGMHTSA
jgi:hypothetical protein